MSKPPLVSPPPPFEVKSLFIYLFIYLIIYLFLFTFTQHPNSLKVDHHKFPNTERIIKRNVSQKLRATFSRPKAMRRPLNQPQIVKNGVDATENKVLQRLLRRFPSALAEINKRLISQNLLWFTLDTRSRHRSRVIGSDRKFF